MRFSSAQRTEFANPAVTAVPLLEITLPDGSAAKITFEESPVRSLTRGYHYPRLKALSSLEPSLDLAQCKLSIPQMEATVSDAPEPDDTVGWFSRLDATYGGALMDAPVAIRVASRADAADWLLAYSGRLVDWSGGGDGTRTLIFRPPDAKLQDLFWLPTIRPDHFPDAVQSVLRQPCNLVWGNCSDRGTTGTMQGYVVCPCVDQTNHVHHGCFGWAKEGLDVFVNGSRLTAGYTWSYDQIGGVRYTQITFTIDRSDQIITANLRGYDTDGDRSGTLITTPGAIIRHFLCNFVFHRALTGEWLADLTEIPVNSASMTAADTALAGRAGGVDYPFVKWLADPATALSVLEGWCKSAGLPPYWNAAGEIALAYDDPHLEPAPSVIYRGGRGLLGAQYPRVSMRNVIQLQTISWAEDGTIPGEITLRDLLAPSSGQASMSMSLGPPTDV